MFPGVYHISVQAIVYLLVSIHVSALYADTPTPCESAKPLHAYSHTTPAHTPPISVTHTATLREPTAARCPSKSITAAPNLTVALKTNLLSDALTALNVEVEVPIGTHWSVAGEWIFPWWRWQQEQVTLQVMSGNLEGRYWLGNRHDRESLTGWFAGVYAGGGVYDVAWKTKGYQGDFFLTTGLSGGYAHTLNRSGSLRMEYALSVGYLLTHYREYTHMEEGDILAWQKNGKYTWLGPTRAKVSLVWTIELNHKRGGGQ